MTPRRAIVLRHLLALCVAACSVVAMDAVRPALAAPLAVDTDFDGDGYADLAIGVADEDIGEEENAGAVDVLYGSTDGLATAKRQIWHQNSPGVKGIAEGNGYEPYDPTDVDNNGDGFGGALATGDFDGDGFDDLAVGAAAEDFGPLADEYVDQGVVHVLYGSSQGLTALGDQIWSQDSPGVKGLAEGGGEAGGWDRFGNELASGDLDGDGRDDLIVSSVESISSYWYSGAINVLYGSPAGLAAAGDQLFHLDTPGVKGTAGPHETFGHSLAVGSFDGDGYDDVAVGVVHDDVERGGTTVDKSGAVNVLYGSSDGLSTEGDQRWVQGSGGVPDALDDQTPEGRFDLFGYSLASGDLDADGYADLAIGVPNETSAADGSAYAAGALVVLYGSEAGLSSQGAQLWTQESAGVPDVEERHDQFSWSLAVAETDGDGIDDLVVGIPYEDVDPGSGSQVVNGGALTILLGTTGGVTSDGSTFWSQASDGVADDPESYLIVPDDGESDDYWVGDEFAAALTADDFDGDGRQDAGVGVHREHAGEEAEAGAVHILYGFGSEGSQFWQQGLGGAAGLAEQGDHFGSSLA